MSYALSIRVNSRSVILAGDGRATPTWDDIYDNCKNILKTCWVLKAGHHGHETGFHEDAVKLMAYISSGPCSDKTPVKTALPFYLILPTI